MSNIWPIGQIVAGLEAAAAGASADEKAALVSREKFWRTLFELEQPIPLISPLNIGTHEVQSEQRLVPFQRLELVRSYSAGLRLLAVCPAEPRASDAVRSRPFESGGCASVGAATGKPVRNSQ